MAGRRARDARPPHAARGQHFLRSPALARTLVDDCGVTAGDLVLDLGAGRGVITAALIERGADVWAVERDPQLAWALRVRFDEQPRVTVLEADARVLEPPRTPFSVVANLPFAGAAAILRHLLDDPRVLLLRAVVVVQREAASKWAAVWPSTLAGVFRGAWYETRIVRRLDPEAFAPPPRVAAAVLGIVRREEPLVAVSLAPAYSAFLRRGFRCGPRATVPRGLLRDVARELGLASDPAARDLDAHAWARLFAAASSARPARVPARRYAFNSVQRGRKGVE